MDTVDLTAWTETLALVMARLVGMATVVPLLVRVAAPVKIRVAGAIVVSLAVVARMAGPAAVPAGAGDLLLAGALELLIGAGIAWTAGLLLMGVQVGAFHVAHQMGLALGEVLNPMTAVRSGPVRSTFTILAIVVFLLIGGHRSLIAAMLKTFQSVPPGSGADGASLLGVAVVLLGSSFALGLKVAGPVLVAMLLATVAMGLLQKTLPQCNILSTHLPVRALLSLVALAGSVAVLQPVLAAAVDSLVKSIAAFG